MFPRYGRTNRKYKVKVPKSKMSFEKIILCQSIISSVILMAGILVSFFGFCPKGAFARVLYTTYNLSQWEAGIRPAATAVKNSSAKLVSMYTDWLISTEKSLGIKSDPKNAVTAKAQNQDKDTVKKHDRNEPEPEAEAPAAAEQVTLNWQVPLHGEISSAFGSRIHPINGTETVHTGVDIAAEEGETIVAAYPGIVATVGYDDANGHYVIIEHDGGITTVYAHMLKASVVKGEAVSPLVKIGEVGSTGISTGPHLHFEIKKYGKSVNPEDYVSFK